MRALEDLRVALLAIANPAGGNDSGNDCCDRVETQLEQVNALLIEIRDRLPQNVTPPDCDIYDQAGGTF